MKPTKCPAKEKKVRQEKWKKRRGEERKRKVKVKTAVCTFKPNLKILLSVHSWTSQVNIIASGPKGRKVYDL